MKLWIYTFLRKYLLVVCVIVFFLISFFYASLVIDLKQRGHQTSGSFGEYISFLRGAATTKQDNRTGATSVLILTYMRSGSSLTGDIIQQATESFYVYEPFHSIRLPDQYRTIISYINGSRSSLPLDINKEKNDAIYNWFTCGLQKISKGSFSDTFMRIGKKSRQVFSCFAKNNHLPKAEKEQRCAEELQTTCLNSPVRILKTIRTELEFAGRLLEDLPNMKIIHLVRDPRATMFSQRSMGRCTPSKGGIQECTNQYCKQLENDVLAEERLVQKYPGRIMTVFYEDIAKNPIDTSRKMFDFIGEDFTGTARDYIYNITSAGRDDSCAICTTRSNSSEHIDTWKTKMDKTFRNVVQERCNYILKRYQYEFILDFSG